jgi:methylenetetrahydrofolate reductase (NADPH)
VVVRINRDYPFPAMAHLTCVGHARADIDALLDEYAANGVENILALGGDLPADGSDPGGDFRYALELVEAVRAHPAGFSIGVAAHPELHPRSVSREDDRRRLAEKLEAADFGVTQFFFEVDPYLRMIDELAELGCDKPVLPGIMPTVNVAGLRRMAGMNGTHLPQRMMDRLDAVADDEAAVAQVGIEVASELGAALLAEDAPGLHLYAMNRSASPIAVHANLALG